MTEAELFKKDVVYWINVHGARGFGTYTKRYFNNRERKWIHCFESTLAGPPFAIETRFAQKGIRAAEKSDWKRLHEMKKKQQAEMVRRYKLSTSDRTLILMNGVRDIRGPFLSSIRIQKSVEKLMEQGLLKKEAGPPMSGLFNYALTPEGLEAREHLYSSSDG